MEGIERVYESE